MAKSTPTTVLEALRALQLLTAAQLQEARRMPQAPAALCQELVRRGWLTAWQAQQLGRGRSVDLRLGPYILLEPLGGGGAGQVFKARHDKMNRLVAVKMLRGDVAQDPEAVQRFHREIEVIGRLAHPNIVHALEAGPIGATLVLVTEFVDGTDLDRLVRQTGPLAPVQACDYIRQAARGLAHAHERGLIHRDIKPSNLIVARSRPKGDGRDTIRQGSGAGTIKILDLGLARLQQPAPNSPTSNLTVIGGAGVMQGTPDYMAPEQALDFHSADIRADLYSLGCTFYFLLAGQAPFGGSSLAEKLMKHQQGKPPPLSRTDLPDGVAAILARLLAKRPVDRFQTPAELDQALTDLLAQNQATSGWSAVTTPALELSDSGPRRHRWLPVLAGGVGLAALLTAVLLFRGSGSTSDKGPSTAAAVAAAPTSNRRPTLPSGELVSNIAAITGKTYATTPARVGAVCYIDRGYKVEKLPPALEGGVLIQTANDDMQESKPSYIAFTLHEPAAVYVIADSKYTRLPAWLDNDAWRLLPETVTFEGQGRDYRIYRRSYPAGRIVLGGPRQPPAADPGGNYFVVVKP